MSAHPNCVNRHICHQPSGRICVEDGCTEPAGTLWGPHWCPQHDRERLDRIEAGMNEIRTAFRVAAAHEDADHIARGEA